MFLDNIIISGFSDEIDADFETQLKVVTELGMNYISLRSAYDKNIFAYTADEVYHELIPLLEKYQVKVSSIGSPVGKLDINDNEGYLRQKEQLDNLCQIAELLECRYIRIFSFYIPQGQDPENYEEEVLCKLKEYVDVAEKHQMILIHENEKGTYGDTAIRCAKLAARINNPFLRLVFDFANFVQCGEDTEVCWNLLKPYVTYIHMKDASYGDHENVVCGTGDGKIPELLQQILVEGYQGFLTLEPHLVRFSQLSELENRDASEVIKTNKAKDGAEAYQMQYSAVKNILKIISDDRVR